MEAPITAALIFAFMISIVTLVVNFGLPILNEQKQDLDFQNGENLVNYLSVDISNLLAKPINSSIQREIKFSNGILTFSNNTIIFSLGAKKYNRTFSNIQFTNLTIYPGRNNLTLIKTSTNSIEVEIK